MRILLLGNAGAGKTTLARRLGSGRSVAHLSLDRIAWREGTERLPLEESLARLRRFIDENEEWNIEGCYGDLIEAALPFCTELHFLNPGIETCVDHCRQRPWEPAKFSSPKEQEAMLDSLIAWVRTYETREDEYGLKRHRMIFDRFEGKKKEHKT